MQRYNFKPFYMVFLLIMVSVFLHTAIADGDRKQGPLTLTDRGSLWLGGETVRSSAPASSGPPFIKPGDEIVVNKTFVQYLHPESTDKASPPVIMVPGGGLLGTQYDTTPDGREGWVTHFLRENYPVYMIEQANRGRAGYVADEINAIINTLKSGEVPKIEDPALGLFQWTNETAWTRWGIGPQLGSVHPNSRYPLESSEQLFASFVPVFVNSTSAKAQVDGIIATLEHTDSGILLTHSLGGLEGFSAALKRPELVKAIVTVEPVACPKTDLEPLAKIPVLALFGDNFELRPEANMQARQDGCQAMADALKAMGGRAEVLSLPEDLNIIGNSHVLMMETNNEEIAKIIMEWLKKAI